MNLWTTEVVAGVVRNAESAAYLCGTATGFRRGFTYGLCASAVLVWAGILLTRWLA